jgi:long-chain acyl-CoA synthetase
MTILKTYPELNTMFRRAAAKFAPLPAFTQHLANGLRATVTYAETERHALRFASYLSEEVGVKPGERVALMLPNVLAYPICAIAALRVGAILVNIDFRASEAEILAILRDSSSRLLVTLDLYLDRLSEVHRETSVRLVITSRLAEYWPAWLRFLVQTNLALTHPGRKSSLFSIPIANALKEIEELGRTCRYELENPVHPHSPALLQYTGGVTGISKAATLTHANLAANMEQVRTYARNHLSPGKETILTTLPQSDLFAFTLNFLLFHSIGAHNIFVPCEHHGESLQAALALHPVTWITGSNSFFDSLTQKKWFAAAKPPHLKFAIAEGSPLHASVAERWQRLVGSPLLEGYGLVEASPMVCMDAIDGVRRAGTIGKPLAETEITILDDNGHPLPPGDIGELAVRGPQVMREYWNRPVECSKTIHDGWLRTGDLATIDGEGYCRVLGRKREIIQIDDLLVYPNEVESIIGTMHDVAEVAVVGIPDKRHGERVHACVVPARREHPVSLETVRSFCKSRLSPYKIPTSLEVVSALPKSSAGRVLHRVALADALRRERMRADPGESERPCG